jgi:glycosylphosphatidylinositol transamidase
MAVSLIPSKQQEVQVVENWRVLKSLCLALTALIVASISLVNFSLGAVMGLVVVIPYSLIQPTDKISLRLLQAIMLTVLSPVVTLYLVAALSGSHVANAVTVLLTDYEVVDVWLLAFMCTAYWPANMALYTVIFA